MFSDLARRVPIPPGSPVPAGRHWLLYDGQCGFCRAIVRLVIAFDRLGLVLPCDLHEAAAGRVSRVLRLSREELLRAMWVITPDGRAISGFFAARRLARLLPAGWPLLPVLHMPGLARLGVPLYAWIAARRDRFGCSSAGACRLTAGPRNQMYS